MEEFNYCSKCGNSHEDDCSTEAVYFYWIPSPFEALPQEAFIIGDWTKWQKKQKMTRVTPSKGLPFFSVLLALSEGLHEYKFIIDGSWKYDSNSPTVYNSFGSLNNVVQILPKKSFKKKMPGERLKLTSNFQMSNLMILGSWDNWAQEYPMTLEYNPLRKCQENVIYLDLQPNSPYEFIFKHKNQYFVDEKYPTVTNIFGTINNIIVIYSKQITTNTPRKTESSPVPAPPLENGDKEIKGRMFAWRKIESSIALPYDRVEGHRMCFVGQYLYIFGGKARSQFLGTIIRINSSFDKVWYEEVMPDGRAYHIMKSYGNKILTYGGHNQEVLDDFNVFNVSSGNWTKSHPLPKSNRTKNEKQSCVLYQSLLVFFGGFCNKQDGEEEELTNAVEVLDIQTMQWVESIELEGQYPPPRFAHTAELIYSDMYVFGGISNLETNEKLNDLWRINLMNVNTMRWQRVRPKGTPPQPRHGHTMNNLSNLLVIFGGINHKNQYLNDVDIYNSTVDEWIIPLVQGSVPRARVNHATANNFHNRIVLFGGRTSEKGKNNEFYLFEATDLSSKPIKLFDEEDSDE